nr:MAG TPA: hypothetical protein [Bacteriophage sp.]
MPQFGAEQLQFVLQALSGSGPKIFLALRLAH